MKTRDSIIAIMIVLLVIMSCLIFVMAYIVAQSTHFITKPPINIYPSIPQRKHLKKTKPKFLNSDEAIYSIYFQVHHSVPPGDMIEKLREAYWIHGSRWFRHWVETMTTPPHIQSTNTQTPQAKSYGTQVEFPFKDARIKR